MILIIILMLIILLLLSKTKKLYVPVVPLSARDNQKQQKLLAKVLKDQFIRMNIKQKVRIKIGI